MHKATKEAHEDNWIKQAADAMDIDLDSDMECVSFTVRRRAFIRGLTLSRLQLLRRRGVRRQIAQAAQEQGRQGQGAQGPAAGDARHAAHDAQIGRAHV